MQNVYHTCFEWFVFKPYVPFDHFDVTFDGNLYQGNKFNLIRHYDQSPTMYSNGCISF